MADRRTDPGCTRTSMRRRAAIVPSRAAARYPTAMQVDAIVSRLRSHQAELAALGVAHVGLFGSRARNEAVETSDIDILIDFEPGRVPDIFTFVGLQQRIAAMFPLPVDVVDRGGLRPAVRADVERTLIRAF